MTSRAAALDELLLRCLDAAVTAPARRRRPGPRSLRALLAGRRFDRIPAALGLLEQIAPGVSGAVSRRLYGAAPLALAATAIEFLDFGLGGTVFRLETPCGPRVLKVFRRSLGRPLAEQRGILAHYAGRYRAVSGWYDGGEPIVARSHFLMLPGPILGRPVAAAVQAYVPGHKLDFFEDQTDAEALARLRDDPALARQFRAFARRTLAIFAQGERCLDLIGHQNLMLALADGRARLAIVDCGVFELPALRRAAPERYASLRERVGRLESLLARLPGGA
jgi:hypothetical protein